MSKIFICAATELEIKPIREELQNLAAIKQVEFFVHGVGNTQTIFSLTKHFMTKNDYDLVIQVGIVGVFGDELKLTQVVQVVKDYEADLGVKEQDVFVPINQSSINHFVNNQNNGIQELKENCFSNKIEYLPKVIGISSQTISDNKRKNSQNKKAFNAQVESMETYGFMFVVNQFNLKSICLKSISNKVGDRKKSNWKIKEAVKEYSDVVVSLINTICIETRID